MKFRIRVGDTVQVSRGTRNRNPDKPATRGRVLSVNRDGNGVIVESHNMRKKHLRKSQQNPQGGILERESPIDMSNVLVVTADGDAIPVRKAARAADGKIVPRAAVQES